MAENKGDGKGSGAGAGKPPAKPPEKPLAEQKRIDEKLPAKLVEAVKKAGYKASQVLRIKSYPEQNIWRVVLTVGLRMEISTKTGEWLNDPKKLKAAKEKRDKAAAAKAKE